MPTSSSNPSKVRNCTCAVSKEGTKPNAWDPNCRIHILPPLNEKDLLLSKDEYEEHIISNRTPPAA